jgi:2-oxoglutarate ferredoxin oxidoreductase subunit beta
LTLSAERALPAATGAKIANPELKVICESGDGCTYGEGGNHFLAAVRRNIGVTMLVHDNQIYGLTKGQASPTSDEGLVTKAQPGGVLSEPLGPVALAVYLKAGFVARGFSGLADHLTGLIRRAMAHDGFALVDILQPCVSFNKVNTFAWYKKRCYEIPAEHDTRDWDAASKLAREWGEKIPVGVIYENDRPAFEKRLPALAEGPLVGRGVDSKALAAALGKHA